MTTGLQHLSMPADFSPATLEAYASLNQRYPNRMVCETYGNLNPSNPLLGTGRTQGALPKVKWGELREIIKHSTHLGIGLNYTLNARCTANMEFRSRSRYELLRHVEFLMDLGVRRITVVVPSVIQIIKARFPEMQVCVSVITNISSVRQAVAYRDMGADRIILSEDLGRNFQVISAIRRAIDLPLELIVNTRCLFKCPFRNADYGWLSHCASAAKRLPVIDYYKWLCTRYLFDNPVEFFKMRWIRPEDLPYYRDVNVFKVIGRQLVEDADLPRTAEAYMSGRFEGDLIELFGIFSPRRRAFYPIRIENKGLDEFIRFFLEGKCADRACGSCGHCETFMRRCISEEGLRSLARHRTVYEQRVDRFAQHLDLKGTAIDERAVAFATMQDKN